jgi:hypothetical protein
MQINVEKKCQNVGLTNLRRLAPDLLVFNGWRIYMFEMRIFKPGNLNFAFFEYPVAAICVKKCKI